MRPLIGITASEIKNKDEPWVPMAFGQKHTYVDAIVRAGGIPVIVPLTEDRTVIKGLYEKLDGILFAGGIDVDPLRYGQKPHAATLEVSALRDHVEVLLIQIALKDGKPVLGICRGMQLLNVALGGSLYQDIATELEGKQNHMHSHHSENVTTIAHTLSILQESKLAEMVGPDPLRTNSYHHQAVKRLGKGLRATAWSEDGIIEAVELMDSEAFVLGVQSHPESLMESVEPRWQALFESFVKAATPTQSILPLEHILDTVA